MLRIQRVATFWHYLQKLKTDDNNLKEKMMNETKHKEEKKNRKHKTELSEPAGLLQEDQLLLGYKVPIVSNQFFHKKPQIPVSRKFLCEAIPDCVHHHVKSNLQ